MFHFFHRWVSVAADLMSYQHYNRRTMQEFGNPEPITEVLQKCSCGKVRTVTLDGHWTLAQINGN